MNTCEKLQQISSKNQAYLGKKEREKALAGVAQ